VEKRKFKGANSDVEEVDSEDHGEDSDSDKEEAEIWKASLYRVWKRLTD
jgi:hypothetical protein